MTLDGKHVVITGASQGIGRALALAYASKCAALTLMARNETRLAESAHLVREFGGHPIVAPADLASADSLREAVTPIREAGGPVHAVIHNAADVTSKPLAETSLDEIDHLVATNLTGVLQLTRLLLDDLRSGGAVVHLSSLAGYKPNPTQTVYSITKRALGGVSDALRAEFAGEGLAVVHAALPAVALEPGQPGVPVQQVAGAIEHALRTGRATIFFSPLTRVLVRLYGAFPALMRVR